MVRIIIFLGDGIATIFNDENNSSKMNKIIFILYIKKEFKMISKDLLEILCCPETKADLVLDGETLVSTDKETRRRYRIEDDIPIMLIEESEQLSMEEWAAIMQKYDRNID
jgi:uncharacterized protein YbaR (Trm112 family)